MASRGRGSHGGTHGPPPDPVKARLLRLHVALLARFGPQHWWPGRTPFEIAVGAILTQHTAWPNAARAIAALHGRRLLRPDRVAAMDAAELAEIIRSAGTYRLKAARLQAFTRWLVARFGGRFAGLRRAPLPALRRELLGVSGLGGETADAILVYAAHRPVFVADAYARRVLARHRLLPATATYEETRAFVEAHVPSDPALLGEFHALIVAVGKAFCRTVPRCPECPLRPDLRGRPPAPSSPGPASPAVPRRRGSRAASRARPSA
jgi:endonuclease-3 related protein